MKYHDLFFFEKLKKKYFKMSAAVVICALRVNDKIKYSCQVVHVQAKFTYHLHDCTHSLVQSDQSTLLTKLSHLMKIFRH